MQMPLTFQDIGLWLAETAIILLITAELISPYYGHTDLLINKKKLKRAALTMGILFLATVAINVLNIISAS